MQNGMKVKMFDIYIKDNENVRVCFRNKGKQNFMRVWN